MARQLTFDEKRKLTDAYTKERGVTADDMLDYALVPDAEKSETYDALMEGLTPSLTMAPGKGTKRTRDEYEASSDEIHDDELTVELQYPTKKPKLAHEMDDSEFKNEFTPDVEMDQVVPDAAKTQVNISDAATPGMAQKESNVLQPGQNPTLGGPEERAEVLQKQFNDSMQGSAQQGSVTAGAHIAGTDRSLRLGDHAGDRRTTPLDDKPNRIGLEAQNIRADSSKEAGDQKADHMKDAAVQKADHIKDAAVENEDHKQDALTEQAEEQAAKPSRKRGQDSDDAPDFNPSPLATKFRRGK